MNAEKKMEVDGKILGTAILFSLEKLLIHFCRLFSDFIEKYYPEIF
jgi:hypothetical protein